MDRNNSNNNNNYNNINMNKFIEKKFVIKFLDRDENSNEEIKEKLEMAIKSNKFFIRK